MRKWIHRDLTQEEKSILHQVYGIPVESERGYSDRRILYVREITERERGSRCTRECPFQRMWAQS